jgi:hypothetical protein
MMHVRHPLVPDRSHGRTPQTQLLIDERNKLLVEASRYYPDCSDREVARRLHTALSDTDQGGGGEQRQIFAVRTMSSGWKPCCGRSCASRIMCRLK